MRAFLRRHALIGLALIATLMTVASCSDTDTATPLDVEVQAAKPQSSTGPVVGDVDPPSAPQDTTLDVTINGSGFDDGSTVEWGVDLDSIPPSTKVITNSVHRVNSKRLIANITIAFDADVAFYDVRVTTPRGKKGIGTEVLEVQKKNDGNRKKIDFQITNFVVEKLPPGDGGFPASGVASEDPAVQAQVDAYERANGLADNFFGCPDLGKTCNRMVLTVTTTQEGFKVWVAHNVRQLFYDVGVERRNSASSWSDQGFPPVDISGPTHVVYWQGQRRTSRIVMVDGIWVWEFIWDVFPDLDAVGSTPDDDQFVFRFGFENTTMAASLNFFQGYADYTGRSTTQRAFAVLDSETLVTTKPRGKKPVSGPHIFKFEVQSFTTDYEGLQPDYHADDVVLASVMAWSSVLMTRPDGSRAMVFKRSAGINPDDPDKPRISVEGYESENLTITGCYEFQLVGVYAHDFDELDVVWNSAEDPFGATPIALDFSVEDPEASTWTRGSCG